MDNLTFISTLEKRISEIKKNKLSFIFTISTTAKIEDNPYLTPTRKTNNFIVMGCVIFDKKMLLQILQIIDGVSDIILVDQEKKIPIKILEDDNEDKFIYTQGTIGSIDTGNFYKLAIKNITKSKVYGFKPNDLTVDAIWSFLNHKNIFLNSCKICIVGAGNIGSKIALKVVECGANVAIYGRDNYKSSIITNGLNKIKAKSTISNIECYDDIIKASFMSDILICSTNGISIIDANIIKTLKKNCIIIEVGKNNLQEEALILATKKNMEIYRLDVTASLFGYIYSLLKTIDILDNSYGKNLIDEINFVSGGYFGAKGDIVTNNCYNPTEIYGEADGRGSLTQEIESNKKNKINKILQEINNNERI